MNYVVAAEGVGWIESKALRAGRRLADAQKIPKGILHAYDSDDQCVACGHDAGSLNIFEDVRWDGGLLPRTDRCSVCLDATEAH